MSISEAKRRATDFNKPPSAPLSMAVSEVDSPHGEDEGREYYPSVILFGCQLP